MTAAIKLPFSTLLLMISFASVNAVLFTPALPDIARSFGISSNAAQATISWFLIGYALGQLLYGPLANRFGRKPALYMGIGLQIISSFLCVLAGIVQEFPLLVFARFLLALGSGVGLKMTFTLVNECYGPKEASQRISYLTLSFAVMPGLSVAIGGILNSYYGWFSCFYASALYGLVLCLLVTRLPETQEFLDMNALRIKHLIHKYGVQFKNSRLIAGGFLLGMTTCYVYIFAALAPFIAMDLLGMPSAYYGFASILPPLGLIVGSLFSPLLIKKYPLKAIICWGILIMIGGTILMLITMLLQLPAYFSMFLPMIVIYSGLCFVMANASVIAMGHVSDKAHGAAIMSFINMGTATLAVLCLGFFPVKELLLPALYLLFGIMMLGTYKVLK